MRTAHPVDALATPAGAKKSSASRGNLSLRAKLEEAEQALVAIRTGDVPAAPGAPRYGRSNSSSQKYGSLTP